LLAEVAEAEAAETAETAETERDLERDEAEREAE
jgi:hypothetical protein